MNTTANDGFGSLLRAELTKLRSVRRWTLALGSAAVLTVLLSLFVAASGRVDANEHPDFVTGPDGTPVADEFQFAHWSLAGDGSIVARVATQKNSHEWAGAGVMVKDGLTPGSRFASVMLTPAHGVRMRSNFSTDLPGSAGDTARWLKLTRGNGKLTGYDSADGNTWREIGSVKDAGFPHTVEIGLFVNSPMKTVLTRQAGSTSMGMHHTTGTASFDNVRVHQSDGTPVGQWNGETVKHVQPPPVNPGNRNDPPEAPAKADKQVEEPGSVTEKDGVFTIIGSGKIGPNPPPDDLVRMTLFGVIAGLIALVAVGVLFMTSEFKRGMLRTTFAATPRRGRVLAAKVVVIGVTAFAVGLVSSVASFYASQPLLRDRGWAPPAFPIPSLFDGPVLRAVLTTSVFLAAIALFGLGLGAILRHSAAAITTVVVLIIAPYVLGSALPAETAEWLMRLTPAGGLATQRAQPPTDILVEPSAMIGPWAGLGVVCAYAAVSLLGAWWLLKRRDV